MLRVIEYFAKSLEVIQGHWHWYHSQAWLRFPIRIYHSNYGFTLYHFRDKAAENRDFFVPPAFDGGILPYRFVCRN